MIFGLRRLAVSHKAVNVTNLRPAGHMWPRMAVNEAQHKVVNLLKISWDFFVIMCHSVFNVWRKTTLLLPVWRRDAKKLDTPARKGWGPSLGSLTLGSTHDTSTAVWVREGVRLVWLVLHWYPDSRNELYRSQKEAANLELLMWYLSALVLINSGWERNKFQFLYWCSYQSCKRN